MPKKKNKRKPDIWYHSKDIAGILTVITIGFTFGYYFGPYFYERDKLVIKLESQRIKEEIGSLQQLIDADSIGYHNWQFNHIHPIHLNDESVAKPFITIVNYTSKSCSHIINDDCWGKFVQASKGDIIVLMLNYKNTGRYELKGPSVALDYSYDETTRKLKIFGGIVVGNSFIKQDSVFIKSSAHRLAFLGTKIIQKAKSDKVIADESVFSSFGLNIGNIPVGSAGLVGTTLRVID